MFLFSYQEKKMSMEQFDQFLDELKKEGIEVQVEDSSRELGEILASRCDRCGSRCGSCAQCKAPETFEEEKMAA